MADVRSRELQVAQRSLQSAQTCLLQVFIILSDFPVVYSYVFFVIVELPPPLFQGDTPPGGGRPPRQGEPPRTRQTPLAGRTPPDQADPPGRETPLDSQTPPPPGPGRPPPPGRTPPIRQTPTRQTPPPICHINYLYVSIIFVLGELW